MKLSYRWLTEWLGREMDTEELSVLLTDIGLEVGGVYPYSEIKGGLEGIVVGEVCSCEKHPDADRLSVCQVDIGLDEPVQIVCGAPNVAAGQKVPVATVGTSLYGPDGEAWKIKKAKIRGQSSSGMICAEDELGIGQSHDGIMVLPEDWPVGTPLHKHIPVYTDTVYDIDLTPNRSDATSHYGSARDVLAALRVREENSTPPLRIPDAEWAEKDLPLPQVELIDPARCPRYAGIIIDHITVGASPDWLRNRLEAIGVRPINNVVDVTNYLLHGWGQPMHAFDLDKVSGDTIKVQCLPAGTPFLGLDGVERKLDAEDLMICDGADKPLCIGGVFGGADSGVTEGTTRVFLESAHFEAISNRRSAVRHDLRTDAHRVFEKGSDPIRCVNALRIATDLICNLTGGQIASLPIDLYPQPINRAIIDISLSEINTLSGHDFSAQDIERILDALDMRYTSGDELWQVKIPHDKHDVRRPADLIEEIMRIYGYNNINQQDRISYTADRKGARRRPALRARLVQLCTGMGLDQAMSMSLTDGEKLKAWPGLRPADHVLIHNTSNAGLETLRPSLLVSALEATQYNHARRQMNLALFELGNTYRRSDDRYVETETLALWTTGKGDADHWLQGAGRDSSFFQLRGYVDSLFRILGIETEYAATDHPQMTSAAHYVSGNIPIATIGQVDPKLAAAYNIDQPIYYGEISVEAIERLHTELEGILPISKYPGARRDIALRVPTDQAYGPIEKLIRQTASKKLINVQLINIYQDDALQSDGVSSYAIQLDFQSEDHTLSDKEIDQQVHKILKRLDRELSISLR